LDSEFHDKKNGFPFRLGATIRKPRSLGNLPEDFELAVVDCLNGWTGLPSRREVWAGSGNLFFNSAFAVAARMRRSAA
jgi:hypothetical protein